MIKVAFDCSALDPAFKSHAHRGIGRYVSRLKDAFDQTMSSEVGISYFDHASLSRPSFCDRLVSRLPAGRTPLRQHVLYPNRLRQGIVGASDLVHYPAHMDAPAWSTKPYVLTVLDLIPHLLSKMYQSNKPSWRFKAARMLEVRAIRNASLLLAISEATANDIVRVLGIPRERIVVTPLGVDPVYKETAEVRRSRGGAWSQALRDKLGIPSARPIILYVGGHDERKNIAGVVEISRKVIDSYGSDASSRPILVLAGRISSDSELERLKGALDRFSMARDALNLGFVSDDALHQLYAESSVFLFPTLYEGFGLPALEAMASGVPVVCSNNSSLPEVVGDAGILFDPRDIDEGANGILSLLRDEAHAANLSGRGADRAALFTWERTAALTRQAYLHASELLQCGLVDPGVCGDEREKPYEARVGN
jgi:glycosyltransferase involved in cell wall biosynthesis